MRDLPRTARIAILTATGFFIVVGIAEAIWLWGYIDAQQSLGLDLVFFRTIAQRWLETGEFYLPRQLAGPYVVETNVDVLYPPNALLLFVPFVWLPWPLWWAIPIGVFAWAIRRLAPAPWTWPLIAAGIVYPPTVSQVLYGNTNMWVAAAVAAGAVLAWPSVLILLKPSFLPFAFAGVRRHEWWVALACLALVSIPFGALWVEYGIALRNSSLSWTHAVIAMPLMLVPVIAWLGSARRPGSRVVPSPAVEAESPAGTALEDDPPPD